MTVTLACGHQADTPNAPRVGMWVSCWALMWPAVGCQTQRRVTAVTGQGVLW